MYTLYSFGVIIIMSILLITAVILLISEPSRLIIWWNRRIKGECDAQDLASLNGIPSYCNVWDYSDKTTLELHRLINIYHDEILTEVDTLLAKSSELEELLWIRFMGEWAGFADQLPVLKQIASLFPSLINLQVVIFHPGATLVEQCANNRMVHRYHYGLRVPRNDVGLKIAGFDVKWEEHEGFVWDNTLPHSIWNHTAESRIIIFADILREFSFVNSVGSKFVYSLTQDTPDIVQKKAELQQETIMIK